MKKLLAIMLILAAASLANAIVLTGTYNPSTNAASVSCISNPESCYIFLAITSGGGTLSNFAKGAQAPPNSGPGFPITGGEVWQMIDMSPSPVYTTGEWLKADFSGSKPSVASFGVFNEETAELTVQGTILIPEPATIAMLCLGGLMLRRNK
jgi:hypothetical protein